MSKELSYNGRKNQCLSLSKYCLNYRFVQNLWNIMNKHNVMKLDVYQDNIGAK